MRVTLSIVLAGIGVLLWFWGGIRLGGRKSYLWKIHAMGIADTIGTLFILAGRLVYSLENWTHLLLAMGSVAFWGTALSFVLARTGADRQRRTGE
jgi:multicomponent Na+:H+ antiporter subunit G